MLISAQQLGVSSVPRWVIFFASAATTLTEGFFFGPSRFWVSASEQKAQIRRGLLHSQLWFPMDFSIPERG